MSNPPNAPTNPLLHNRYRIQARLGENRLALVFRAHDERLNRSVLVHLLRPELMQNPQLKQRFADEAQGLAKRTHPALLEVFDNGDLAGRPYMITEDVQGQLLAEMLPVGLNRAIQMLRQVVGGVATTISTNTPTPPISSRSIIVTKGGRAVLIEPWWLSGEDLRRETLPYRAPERAQGGAPDERGTVFSLGILGYEMIGGKRMTLDDLNNVNSDSKLPVIYSMLNGFVPSLAAALTLATIRDVDTRTATVAAFARDLAAVESAADSPTKQIVRPVPAMRDSVKEVRRSITQRRSQPMPQLPPQQAPSAAAANPVMQAPPPRPVMPPVQQYQPHAQQPALSKEDLRQELRREIRREARRRGCISFIWRKGTALVIVGLLVLSCFWGLSFGRNWLMNGGAKTWACSWLPQWGCNFLPGSTIATFTLANDTPVYQNADVNSQVIETLPANTRVTVRNPNTNITTNGWAKIEVNNFEGRNVNGWIDAVNLQKSTTTDTAADETKIVFKTSVIANMRSEPTLTQNNIIAQIPQNTIVTVTDLTKQVEADNNIWYPIEVELDGKKLQGWIASGLLTQENAP